MSKNTPNASLKKTIHGWSDWISDMLLHGFANPTIPNNDGPQMEVMFDFLNKSESLSVANYQTALVIELDTQVSKLKYLKEERASGYIRQIMSTLWHCSDPTPDKEALIKMFFDQRFDDLRLQGDNIEIKSSLLQVLSKGKFDQNEKEKILEKSVWYMYNKIDDSVFYSGVLRFCHRQYSVKKFLDMFFEIIDKTTKDNLSQGMSVMLIDKIEEVNYHYKEVFNQEFPSFLEKLKKYKNLPEGFVAKTEEVNT
ncbi:MAG: hypothetical protein OEX08_01740 [Candidatus Nomurabacteria bacterium]|nr:hypothetical protein [Candidatus Nomurabacteria bacterium]